MTAVIIEDEPLAIDNLKFYLRGYPVEIVGSAYRINEAVKLISEQKPDVVFLDINLSGENGFDLLDKVEMNFKLVFVTAYNEYAVRAFEVNALDYILKPLSTKRINKTLCRLLENNKSERELNKYTIDDEIFISCNRAGFIKVKNIIYIEADSCYSRLHLADGSIKVFTRTLKKWEDLLPESHFRRIHRSYIVNLNFIDEIKKRDNGSCLVLLKDSVNSIEISRRFASGLRNSLTNKNM
ncbi:MAG: LytTR family DNA-binding domain-containing protein [Ignavibacteriaceae bacterium]